MVDGKGWLDRFGGFFQLYPDDWSGDLIKAEHEAGWPHRYDRFHSGSCRSGIELLSHFRTPPHTDPVKP